MTLLRARFPRPKGPGKPRASRTYILSGLAYCSECGRKLMGSGGTYRCMPRNGGCSKIRIVAWVVDLLVWEAAFARAPEPEQPDAPDAPGVPDALVAELRDVEARQLEIREAYAAGDLTLPDFRGMSEALARRASELEGRIRDQARPQSRVDFAKLAKWEDIEGRMRRRELEPDQVAEIHDWLDTLVERITVSPALRQGPKAIEDIPARVRVEWRVYARRRPRIASASVNTSSQPSAQNSLEEQQGQHGP